MMFVLSDEQEELRRTVRAFLEARASSARTRELMATDEGWDRDVWAQLAEQLELQGLAIPEEYGGLGYSFVELGIVLEEMGRALLCAPYFSSVVLAAHALLHAGDEAAAKEWLPGIASGAVVATVAIAEEDGSWDESGVATTARRDADEWLLDGSKSFVVDGHKADLVLVVARSEAGLSLFAVEGTAQGLVREVLPTLDQTRKLARLELSGVVARLVGREGEGWSVVSTVLDVAAAGLAAEQVGGAQKALEMAVDYAKLRVQFGRPIGSFQAIKHTCADMLLAVESAKSAAQYACWAAAHSAEELPVAASLAKAYCSESYFKVAAANIQVHGGVGFTWEHDAHLYFKRAKSSELLFGDPTYHREQVADLVGL